MVFQNWIVDIPGKHLNKSVIHYSLLTVAQNWWLSGREQNQKRRNTVYIKENEDDTGFKRYWTLPLCLSGY